MNCAQATRLYSESRERRLPLWQRLSLWLHMFMCVACRRFGRQVRWLDRLAARWANAGDDVGEGLSPQAKRAIMQKMTEPKK